MRSSGSSTIRSSPLGSSLWARAAVVVLAVIPVLAASDAWAAAPEEPPAAQTWAVAPADAEGPDGRAAFEYVVEPGDVYVDHVAVRNLGSAPLTVTLYAQDAVQSVDSAFEVLTPDERGDRIGEWLRLDASEVTVPARDAVVVPFAIDVPSDAEPGDHAGGVVAVTAPQEGASDGALVQYRVGSRIDLRVAGPVDAALRVDTLEGRYETRWALFAPSPLDVTATLENTGNIRVVPEAEVRATGLFGAWTARATLEGYEEVLPDGAQTGAVRVPDVPPIGPIWLTVDVVSVSSAGQDVSDLAAIRTQTVVVWAVPWVLVAVVALLATAAIIAIVNLRRRRRQRRADAEPPAPIDPSAGPEGEAAGPEGDAAGEPATGVRRRTYAPSGS